MSKSLSEQDFTDIYLKILRDFSSLRAAHGKLEAENDRLATENAEFESIGNRSLEKISELEEECDQLRAENEHLRDVRDDLTVENTALRAGQGYWPDGDHHSGDQVPRVIGAEEVEVGQLLAVWGHDEPTGHPIHTIGVVSQIHDGSVLFEGGGMWFELIEDAKDDDCTIVLLADAPGLERDAAPRLTVHALNTAPVGSKLERARFMPWRKRDDGKWVPDWQLGRNALTSEDLIADGWADATLTHPERGDHE